MLGTSCLLCTWAEWPSMGKNALGCKSTVQAVGTQLAHSERPSITGQRAAPAIGLKVSQGNVGVN